MATLDHYMCAALMECTVRGFCARLKAKTIMWLGLVLKESYNI